MYYKEYMNMSAPQMGPVSLESLVDFQTMVFIYNAINDGWTVKKISSPNAKRRYEFRKDDEKVYSENCLDDYLKRFVDYYKEIKMLSSPSLQTK
jgi:hypothetical protein